MNPARALPTYASLIADATARLAAAGIDTARLDAEVLLGVALGVGRSGVYARLPELAADDIAMRLSALVDRRARREPVAYITGVQEFWSLRFAVTPAVLIPRPETELLVEIVRALATDAVDSSVTPSTMFICDIGTGSGCIAVALACELADARIVAVDISPEALAVARRNATTHGVGARITFVRGDLLDGLGQEQFDVIVSNPPYLRPDDRTCPELAFEPPVALEAGGDGLAVIRRILAEAPRRLRPNGWVVMELGAEQGEAVGAIAAEQGFTSVAIELDLAGLPRVLVAQVG